MLRALTYNYIKPLLERLAAKLNRHGINPAHLTLSGLIVNVFGCILYAYGHFLTGSLVILIAGVFDMLDGVLARSSGKVTVFGGFMDSVVDRYSDFLIFGGLLIYFARVGEVAHASLALVVIAGALLTSYTKARAESLIPHCNVGWVERPERIVIICAGGIFQFLVPALWILAFTTHLTAFQRIFYTWKETVGSTLPKTNETTTPAPPQQKITGENENKESYRQPKEI